MNKTTLSSSGKRKLSTATTPSPARQRIEVADLETASSSSSDKKRDPNEKEPIRRLYDYFRKTYSTSSLDDMTTQRGANKHFFKLLRYVHACEKDGYHPGKIFDFICICKDEGFWDVCDKTEHERQQERYYKQTFEAACSLYKAYQRAKDYGCFEGKELINDSESKNVLRISRGFPKLAIEKGLSLSVDHSIPVSIAPNLSNVLQNLDVLHSQGYKGNSHKGNAYSIHELKRTIRLFENHVLSQSQLLEILNKTTARYVFKKSPEQKHPYLQELFDTIRDGPLAAYQAAFFVALAPTYTQMQTMKELACQMSLLKELCSNVGSIGSLEEMQRSYDLAVKKCKTGSGNTIDHLIENIKLEISEYDKKIAILKINKYQRAIDLKIAKYVSVLNKLSNAIPECSEQFTECRREISENTEIDAVLNAIQEAKQYIMDCYCTTYQNPVVKVTAPLVLGHFLADILKLTSWREEYFPGDELFKYFKKKCKVHPSDDLAFLESKPQIDLISSAFSPGNASVYISDWKLFNKLMNLPLDSNKSKSEIIDSMNYFLIMLIYFLKATESQCDSAKMIHFLLIAKGYSDERLFEAAKRLNKLYKKACDLGYIGPEKMAGIARWFKEKQNVQKLFTILDGKYGDKTIQFIRVASTGWLLIDFDIILQEKRPIEQRGKSLLLPYSSQRYLEILKEKYNNAKFILDVCKHKSLIDFKFEKYYNVTSQLMESSSGKKNIEPYYKIFSGEKAGKLDYFTGLKDALVKCKVAMREHSLVTYRKPYTNDVEVINVLPLDKNTQNIISELDHDAIDEGYFDLFKDLCRHNES